MSLPASLSSLDSILQHLALKSLIAEFSLEFCSRHTAGSVPWLRCPLSPPAGLRRSSLLAPEVRHLCGNETTPQTCDPVQSAPLAVAVVARVLALCA